MRTRSWLAAKDVMVEELGLHMPQRWEIHESSLPISVAPPVCTIVPFRMRAV
jgi:hypothetical protein